ncbi:P68 family surface lipoprotein [Mycoplasmoides pneumoniae]|uniref:P68 family surface lipoprotein n=1 Tax=Mycoplasmoides pneumoniae TaxID=2104 RepID=UPI002329EDA9|nr:P80 family lipoprotein [Mycoplasmoides pneumoniae]GLL57948.1 hypothetical protein KPI25BX_7130 [Mycoplasmoides pneumoniae]
MKFKYGATLFSGFLGLSAILAACGAKGKFDQVDDGKIVLASSLTSKNAANALQAVVEKYNQVKGGNDYPIEITQITGGYDGGRGNLQTKLSVKDKTTFYNLILNYPDLVSTLRRVGMELPLDNVDLSKLSPNFLKFNERISGVAKKANYAIPVSLSTEVLALNGPVLHYILNSAKGGNETAVTQRTASTNQQNTLQNSLKINESDPITKELWEKIQKAAETNGKAKEQGKSKKQGTEKTTTLTLLKTESSQQSNTTKDGKATSDEAIKKTWGDYQKVENGLKGYTFKASVFENWHELLDFSARIARSFTNIHTKETKKGTDIQGVLGIDSTPNALFTSVFAAGGGNYDNFFYKVQDGRADFSNFKNKETSYQNLQKVFSDYKELIDKNGLFVNKGGSYSSNFQKFHQLAYSISSTSGFFYSFAGNSAKRLKFDDGNFIEFPRFTQPVKAPNKTTQSGGENNNKSENNLLGTFEIEDKSKKRESVESSEKSSSGTQSKSKKGKSMKTIYLYKAQIPEGKNKGDNAILITNQTVIDKLEKAAKEDGKSGTQVSTVASKSTTKENQENKIIGYTSTDNLREDNKNIFDIDDLNDEKYDRKIIVSATEEVLEQSNTLQSEEAVVLPALAKYKASDSTKIAITQEPNLIGIHANEKENEETRKFVNWFLNSEQTWESKKYSKNKQNSNEKRTPAQFFADSASYILPLKKTFDNANKKEDQSKANNKTNSQRTNTYIEKALEIFKGISQNQITSYSDPSDFRSGRFRDGIGSNFNAVVNSKVDFNKFINNFIASLGFDI